MTWKLLANDGPGRKWPSGEHTVRVTVNKEGKHGLLFNVPATRLFKIAQGERPRFMLFVDEEAKQILLERVECDEFKPGSFSLTLSNQQTTSPNSTISIQGVLKLIPGFFNKDDRYTIEELKPNTFLLRRRDV